MKAAIFDMDGTLIDSMEAWGKACVYPLDKNNINYPDDILNIVTPLGVQKTAEYYRALGIKENEKEIIKLISDEMKNQYKYKINIKPYVYEYLEKLYKLNIKMCILTATAREIAMPCLERLDLMKYFEFFASCDELGLTKSNPEIFVRTANKLGFDILETSVFDDNSIAVESAKKSGAFVCGVYDKSSEKNKEAISKICDKYIYSFKELL